MEINNKEIYRQICQEKGVPFFQQDWWLDIVCDNKWNVIINKKNELLLGALPYHKVKKAKIEGIGLPILTQYMGPILFYPSKQKYSKKISFEKNVLKELYLNLPKVPFVKQTWFKEYKNWLPLHWLGYKHTTRFSYIIEDISNLKDVYKGLETKIRGDIKKAEKQVEVKETYDFNIIYNLVEKTFFRKNMKMPYSKKLLSSIVETCEKRNQGKTFYAIDKEKNIHAAVFIVWDNNTAYYLLGGGDSDFRNSGATSLLLWEAMNKLPSNVTKFDFEGSMIEPVEKFVRGFGGKQIQLNIVSKIFSKKYYLLEKVHEFKTTYFRK